MAHDHTRLSVIDGRLANVSATVIQGFKRCPRFWFYAEVERRPKKETGKKGATLGTECHDRMEKWLTTGQDIRGPIERFGDEMIRPFVQWAPFNGGPMLVEEKFKSLKTPGGVIVNGSFDALLPPGTARAEYATLLDHKFKKDLAKWATPSEKLLVDEQFVVYGYYALSIFPDAKGVYFRHHNHQTNSRRNLVVECEDTRAGIFEKFAALGKLIDSEMAPCVGKQAKDVLALPGQACRAFGGCDFEDVCPDSPRNRATANIFGLTDSVLTVNNEPSPKQETLTMGLINQMLKAGTAPIIQKTEITADPPKIQKTEITADPPNTIAVTAPPSVSKENSLPLIEAAKNGAALKEVDEKKPRAARTRKTDEPQGLTLLVDCFSARAQDITPWALDLAKQLAQRHKVQDIRVAPKESDLSYGGWRACIAAEAVKTPPTGVCYLAGSELTEPVIEALTAVASMVVRGRR